MKVSLSFALWLAYCLFGTGIAALAVGKGQECFGYPVSEQNVQIFGAVCLTLGCGWMAKLHVAMLNVLATPDKQQPLQ